MDIAELGERLATAGRLKMRPLCVWGVDEIPPGAAASSSIDRCLARAIYICALHPKTPVLYLNGDQGGCCPGGMAWMGYADLPPAVKYFLTTGLPGSASGQAEHLKATPELFEEQWKRAGKIRPPGRYVAVGPCNADIDVERAQSIILFAESLAARNLCALAQYSSPEPFHRTVISSGSACSTMITYPAGMAENAWIDSVYIGPADPTVNPWLPGELMVLGIPVGIARQMAADLEGSFITRRAGMAYPESRS